MPALLLLTLLLASQAASGSTLSASVAVDLSFSGLATVTYSVSAPEAAEAVELALIAEPEALVAYGEGGPIHAQAFMNSSGWFAKVYYPPSSFNLTFVTAKLANYSGGFWTAGLTCPYIAEVRLPQGVVPTRIPRDVLDMGYVDGRLIVKLPPGSHFIEYAVLVELPPGPSPAGGGGVPSGPGPQPTPLGVPLALLVAALAVGAMGLGAALTILRRRRGGLRALDDLDRAVVELVKRRGPLSVAEVAEQLGIPRSTAHRKLRKLAKYGLIDLKKMGVKLLAS
jgi:uncharacterized membrane protein